MDQIRRTRAEPDVICRESTSFVRAVDFRTVILLRVTRADRRQGRVVAQKIAELIVVRCWD